LNRITVLTVKNRKKKKGCVKKIAKSVAFLGMKNNNWLIKNLAFLGMENNN
jgi:hypothetical protein